MSLAIITELRQIAQANGGMLIPETVIEQARSAKSKLHKHFCWDDNEAAHKYRIWQARMLIRTTVQYAEINGDKRPVRVFVSLSPDRKFKKGGYREIVTVLTNKTMRMQMIQDALEELNAFENKYAHLNELAGIFAASRIARSKLLKKAA